MKRPFGLRSDGRQTYLYTITDGKITAEITDHGATLVRLLVPDANGQIADVVLGYDTPDEYTASGSFFGATVGRNANRIDKARFTLSGKEYQLEANDGGVNNLHSGFDPYKNRLWQVVSHETAAIKLRLDSPDGDQGFPGNAEIFVEYALKDGALTITYDATCDQDTVFNMTNHSYFNLAGHDHPEKAMDQLLRINAHRFNPDDAMNIPTGELRAVVGTPMDFRAEKTLARDIGQDYDALKLQYGYDHNWIVDSPVCATLRDAESGRTMTVITDCPGIQVYSGNFLEEETGKDGVHYCRRGGVALETQFFPDSVNHAEWKQPFTRAGERYHSVTTYRFA